MKAPRKSVVGKAARVKKKPECESADLKPHGLAKPGLIEHGVEKIGKREIPLKRFTNQYGGIVTLYGNEDEGCLRKVEMDGKTVWYATAPASEMDGFEGSRRRQLQGLRDTAELRALWEAVQRLRLTPLKPGAKEADKIKPIHDTRNPDARLIREMVMKSIIHGNRHNLDLLAKVIEAIVNPERFKSPMLVAVETAAQKVNRVPSAPEVLQCYGDLGRSYDSKAGYEALRAAGFGWLIESV